MAKDKQKLADDVNKAVAAGEPVWILVEASQVSQMPLGQVLKRAQHGFIMPATEEQAKAWDDVAKDEMAAQRPQQ